MENYIKPINQDNVSGINISYDDEFQKLQVLVQEKPEQQFGEFIAEAEGRNWDEIYDLSSKLLLYKSKDLLVMSYFTQSSIVKFGLSGLSNGLHIIYENIRLYWEDIYPHLEDEDGDYDPDFRINALSLFSSYDGIVKEIRDAFLIKDSLSQTSYNVKAIENIINDRSDCISYPGGFEKLSIDLQIAIEQENKELVSIIDSLDYLRKINDIFEKNLGISLKFDAIIQLLSRILKIANTKSTLIESEPNNNNSSPTFKTAPKEKLETINWANYQISSRKDINLLLEKIYIYFEKNEPSHPAPLFIRRIQKLLSLNFYEIMKDISPESLDKLEILVGEPMENNDHNKDDYS